MQSLEQNRLIDPVSLHLSTSISVDTTVSCVLPLLETEARTDATEQKVTTSENNLEEKLKPQASRSAERKDFSLLQRRSDDSSHNDAGT
jgi:hypothetical protein